MTRLRDRRLGLAAPALAAVALMAAGGSVLAQDATPTAQDSQDSQDMAPSAYVIDINAGSVSGAVSLRGAALAPIETGSFWFSDGTDVIAVAIDPGSSTAPQDMPLLTLVDLSGTINEGRIDVSKWAPLNLMTPAVVRTPAEVQDAFMAWIVAQSSQAPQP